MKCQSMFSKMFKSRLLKALPSMLSVKYIIVLDTEVIQMLTHSSPLTLCVNPVTIYSTQ